MDKTIATRKTFLFFIIITNEAALLFYRYVNILCGTP